MLYNSIEEMVGNTPLMRVKKYEEFHSLKANILVKIEKCNPAGSVKDRVALYMIKDAEEKGLINKDTIIIEPTSGNTGIGIACFATIKGYKTILVMPENMSQERIKLLKAYGAEVILTKAEFGMQGAIEKANEIAKQNSNSFLPSQFDNISNIEAHKMTTGPEIWKDTNGDVDFFVAGVGTGGTITGIGEYLKEHKDSVKIIAVEPKDSPLLSEGRTGSHGIQGIGANFIPSILNQKIYDEVVTITTEEAYSAVKELVKTEGLLVGISSGASLSAATKLAQLKENEGKTFVVLLPDSGERYLSTPLFS